MTRAIALTGLPTVERTAVEPDGTVVARGYVDADYVRRLETAAGCVYVVLLHDGVDRRLGKDVTANFIRADDSTSPSYVDLTYYGRLKGATVSFAPRAAWRLDV